MKKYLFIIVLFLLNFSIAAQENHIKLNSYLKFDKYNLTDNDVVQVIVKASITKGWHINSAHPNEDYLIPTSINLKDSTKYKIKKIVFPSAQNLKLAISDKPLSVWEGDIYILLEIEVLDKSNIDKTIGYEFDYQSCNNSVCLPPETVNDSIQIATVKAGEKPNEINKEIFAKLDGTSANQNNSVSQMFADKGLALTLILIFILGLGLNLTPCVYPLIPITIGFFGGQSEGNTKRLFLMGLMFVLGMALTYSIVGVVTSLTGAMFGSLLQNIYVVLAITLIFIALALSMFGVYEFRLPNSVMNKAGGAKTGLWGAFFMGLTMGIVAAPCIGPFVLGLIAYVAAVGNPFFGFLLFFIMALGLGAPYLLLAVFSGKIKSLPRAGFWMEAVKHIFGFILLGMAIYFVSPKLNELIGISKEVISWLLPIYIAISGIILLFMDKEANKNKVFLIIKSTISLALIVASISLIVNLLKPENSIRWEKFEGNVSVSFSGKKGMILDFYADWCIPCKELDGQTFNDPDVVKESSKFIAYKVDLTKSLSPKTENIKEQYKVVGVPTIIILNSKGEEVKRITGLTSPKDFLNFLKSAE